MYSERGRNAGLPQNPPLVPPFDKGGIGGFKNYNSTTRQKILSVLLLCVTVPIMIHYANHGLVFVSPDKK